MLAAIGFSRLCSGLNKGFCKHIQEEKDCNVYKEINTFHSVFYELQINKIILPFCHFNIDSIKKIDIKNTKPLTPFSHSYVKKKCEVAKSSI